MKAIKLLISALVITTFSSCYFLDYVIPEEYFADEPESYSYPYYVWISHPAGIQCEGLFFHSLAGAENFLKNRSISIYGSKTTQKPQEKICGYPTETWYYIKINKNDISLAVSEGWIYRTSSVGYNMF